MRPATGHQYRHLEAKVVGLDVYADAWVILATAERIRLGDMLVAGDGMKSADQ
jgi:hypothetical protein